MWGKFWSLCRHYQIPRRCKRVIGSSSVLLLAELFLIQETQTRQGALADPPKCSLTFFPGSLLVAKITALFSRHVIQQLLKTLSLSKMILIPDKKIPMLQNFSDFHQFVPWDFSLSLPHSATKKQIGIHIILTIQLAVLFAFNSQQDQLSMNN